MLIMHCDHPSCEDTNEDTNQIKQLYDDVA